MSNRVPLSQRLKVGNSQTPNTSAAKKLLPPKIVIESDDDDDEDTDNNDKDNIKEEDLEIMNKKRPPVRRNVILEEDDEDKTDSEPESIENKQDENKIIVKEIKKIDLDESTEEEDNNNTVNRNNSNGRSLRNNSNDMDVDDDDLTQSEGEEEEAIESEEEDTISDYETEEEEDAFNLISSDDNSDTEQVSFNKKLQEAALSKIPETYEDQKNGFIKHINKNVYVNGKISSEKKEFILPPKIYDCLFWYQREGVDWLWNLFCKKSGGILGDDMGLGKTMQIISFLYGMHTHKHIGHSLIVMPVSLIEHWIKEFEKFKPNFKVKVYHGSSVKERENALKYIQKNGGVCITTYGMIVSNCNSLKSYGSKQFTWDYIILDEGHKIKETKTKISKTMRELTSNHKILMTGTAIQNNLRELWSLFDWVCDGTLLGNVRTFSQRFEKPIFKAHVSDSKDSEKKHGSAIAETLRKIISPHFLRREKKDIFKVTNNNTSSVDKDYQKMVDIISPSKKPQTSNTTSISTPTPTPDQHKSIGDHGIKTQKNDFIVWSKLADAQISLYETFLQSDEVKNALNKTSSPLAALSVLKKICDHPLLLHEEMKTCNSDDMKEVMGKVGENQTIGSLINNSGKMKILKELLPNLKIEGHRVLIFSQSTKMLDAIQILLDHLNLTFLRIDGTITSTKERQRRIDLFNKNTEEYFCFILTIQVGALGLNLTSADRVVIFDPSWNTVDNQAVDRVYRIGQKRNVIVYRLITCGTIEEKIYRKQVFKGSLMRTMLDQGIGQHRYFSKTELSDVFTLGDTETSVTQIQLESLHSSSRKTYPELIQHLKFLEKSRMIFGVSDHDLLFSDQVEADHDENDLEMARISHHHDEDDDPYTPSKRATKKKAIAKYSNTPRKTQRIEKGEIYNTNGYGEDEECIEVDSDNNDDDEDDEFGYSVRGGTGKRKNTNQPIKQFNNNNKINRNTSDLSHNNNKYSQYSINDSDPFEVVSSDEEQQRQRSSQDTPPSSQEVVDLDDSVEILDPTVALMNSDIQTAYNNLIDLAIKSEADGDIKKSLGHLVDAYQLSGNEKVQQWVQRLFLKLDKKR